MDEDMRDENKWHDPKEYMNVPHIDYLVHWVEDERTLNFVLKNGLVTDGAGVIYLSKKPIREDGYAFKVKIPDNNCLHDWREIWCDEDGYETDFDHEYDKNNPYYIYVENIPPENLTLIKRGVNVMKVREREFYGKAALTTHEGKEYARVKPNLAYGTLLYEMEDFERDFTYADGRKIEKGSLRANVTIDCKKNNKHFRAGRKEGNNWVVSTNEKIKNILDSKTFAVCYEPVKNDEYKSDAEAEREKKAKALPVIPEVKVAVRFITKSGGFFEEVRIAIQGNSLVYGVGNKVLIKKPIDKGYKSVGTLTRGIKKAIEELVWDGSNHVTQFEVRDYRVDEFYFFKV